MLHIRCLGQFSVQRDGRPLGGATAQPKRLAVLALLACAGDRGITRDKLVALLWPGAADDRGLRLVSQALWALRRDLGHDDAIEGARDIRLNPREVTSDVAEFQRAAAEGAFERAAATYGGPLLDGFHPAGVPDFARWLESERAAVAHEYAEVLERCAGAAEARSDRPAAVSWRRKLASQDPLNTRAALGLMRALAAAGDRAGAIRHAEIHAALIEQELELPPDPAVATYALALREAPTPLPDVLFEPPAPASRTRAAALPGDQGAQPAPGGPRPGGPRRRPRWWRWMPAVAATALFIAVSAVVLRARRGAVAVGRVVVAPLENRTGDAALDPIGLMAAEWITHGLSRTGLVSVVDAGTMLETARAVRRSAVGHPTRALAQRTRAELVVAGSFYRDRDTLLLQIEIADGASGDVRRSVDAVRVAAARPTEALEPLRQRVTGALAVLLDNRLNNWTAVTSQPPSYEAYQEFLAGMELFGIDYSGAIEHFARAAALDSTYWQALLWAGMSYANSRNYPPADSLFAILSRHRAQLAPYDQANLDYFYGGFVLGDWERAYQGAQRMTRLAPAAAHAHFALGLTALITNRADDAVAVLERIDTEEGWGRDWDLRIWNLLARANHHLGRHEAELRWARRMRAAEPNAGWTRLPEVRALAALGRVRDALRRVDEGAVFAPSRTTWEPYSPGDFLAQAGLELQAHGRPDLARDLLARAARWYQSDGADTTAGRRGLADVLEELERWDDAAALFQAMAARHPDDVTLTGAVGVTAQRRGLAALADSALARLEAERRPYLFGQPRYQAARIAAVRGEQERAVGLLRQARREGSARIWQYHLERDFESLRDYAPYRELLGPRTTAP